MSVIKCLGCGHDTNTTTCDYIIYRDRIPRKCYVRWINDKPEKGCGFDALTDKWYRKWCLDIIKRG